MFPIKIREAISQAKLEANRTNSQLSTGPTSPEGKARSSKNATRHGLTGQVFCLPADDLVAFHKFAQSVIRDYNAEGVVECQLAQTIAEGYWRLNRGCAIDNNTFAMGYSDGSDDRFDSSNPHLDDAMTQAVVFERKADSFAKIALYEQRLNRNIEKQEKRLRDMQSERRSATAQAVEEMELLIALDAAEGTKTEQTKPTYDCAGFVLSTPQILVAINRKNRLERARKLFRN